MLFLAIVGRNDPSATSTGGVNIHDRAVEHMKAADILCVFHYVPLHSSPFGRENGRAGHELSVTDDISDRLVRLPLWLGMEEHQDRIIETAISVLRTLAAS